MKKMSKTDSKDHYQKRAIEHLDGLTEKREASIYVNSPTVTYRTIFTKLAIEETFLGE